MQLALEPATVKDVDTLVAFERKVADPRIYGPALDVQGALQAISKNTFYFIKMGDLVVGTAAYWLRPDKSVYISNVAVHQMYRRQGIARAAMSFILEKCKGTHRVDLLRILRIRMPFSYTSHSVSRWNRIKRIILAMANHDLCSC